MKLLLMILLMGFSSITSFAGDEKKETEKTSLNGTIINYSDDEPLAGVKILIKELDKSIYTDIDGNFSIDNLPIGEYSLVIQHPSYSEKSIQGVTMEKETELKIRLFPN